MPHTGAYARRYADDADADADHDYDYDRDYDYGHDDHDRAHDHDHDHDHGHGHDRDAVFAHRPRGEGDATVARLAAHFGDVRGAHGMAVDRSVSSRSLSSEGEEAARLSSVPDPYTDPVAVASASFYQYPHVNRPSRYRNDRVRNDDSFDDLDDGFIGIDEETVGRFDDDDNVRGDGGDRSVKHPYPHSASQEASPRGGGAGFTRQGPGIANNTSRYTDIDIDEEDDYPQERMSPGVPARAHTPASASDAFLFDDEPSDVSRARSQPGYSHLREPSNSSTIRSSGSSGSPPSSRHSDGRRFAHPPPSTPVSHSHRASNMSSRAQSQNQFATSAADALRANPPPKAKVVILRRVPHSQSMDSDPLGEQPRLAARADAVSSPALPSFEPMFDSAGADGDGPRTLVTEYSDPAELRRGRVSLINLMATNTETVIPDDIEDADFDFEGAVNVSESRPGQFSAENYVSSAGKALVPHNDPYMDPDVLADMRQAEVLGHYHASQGKKPGAKTRILRRFGGKKEEKTESRYVSKEANIERRATMVSGAIDRISIAADPFVDFLTSNPSTAPPKGRFSKFMSKLFGSSQAKQERKLLKQRS